MSRFGIIGPLGFKTLRWSCQNRIGPARPGPQYTMATLIFWKISIFPSGGLICNRGHTSPKMPKRAQRAVLASLGPLGFVTIRGTCQNRIGTARPGPQCTIATLIFWKISIFAQLRPHLQPWPFEPIIPKLAPLDLLALIGTLGFFMPLRTSQNRIGPARPGPK